MKMNKPQHSSSLNRTHRAVVRNGQETKLCDIYNVVDPEFGITDQLVAFWPMPPGCGGSKYYYLDDRYVTQREYASYFAEDRPCPVTR